MSKPIAILVSDVHYSLNTLELADKAFRMAIDKASELKIPLIDCGDLTNDKAILRAEVANRLIKTMTYAKSSGVKVYLVVGNHSLCHEKGKEHALEFLRPYVSKVIDKPWHLDYIGYCIPYHTDPLAVKDQLVSLPKGITILMHQGFHGANTGHYVKDASAISVDLVRDYRVISGHYHTRQDVGTVSYVGNPYSLTFGEANDPAKGFQVLNDDGSLTFVPTNLRKHIVYEVTTEELKWGGLSGYEHREGDLLWLKVSGPRSELDSLPKEVLAGLLGTPNFKLDKIVTGDSETFVKADKLTGEEIMDGLIDKLGDSSDYKVGLKRLWRDIL